MKLLNERVHGSIVAFALVQKNWYGLRLKGTQHNGDEVNELLKQYHIFRVKVPPGELQPMNLSINKSWKSFLHDKFKVDMGLACMREIDYLIFMIMCQSKSNCLCC